MVIAHRASIPLLTAQAILYRRSKHVPGKFAMVFWGWRCTAPITKLDLWQKLDRSMFSFLEFLTSCRERASTVREVPDTSRRLTR
jgi:hypothetical protein